MLNTVYQLTAPRKIDLVIRDEKVEGGQMIVRPTYLSICNADQRYYQGTRSAAVLAKKLPMALIHECIGDVVVDHSRTFLPGDTVVMIPNLPSAQDDVVAENYLRSSRFRASSADGFTQELVITTPDRCIKVPPSVKPEVAAFTELCSVSRHAISRFLHISHTRLDSIGVWGDGNVGFITSLFLKKILPETKIIVFGPNEHKLADFTFADEVYLISRIPDQLAVDHAFECVGGSGCEPAISQIIDHIAPEGTISLMGVSENAVPINTRMVLEKGLRLFGSSRSGRKDFIDTLALYEDNPSIPSYLERIVGQVLEVRTISDIDRAFEADIKKRFGKTIMKWCI